MKKAIILFATMALAVFFSVTTLSAAFVYPAGSVKYSRNFLTGMCKTTTKACFHVQEHAGTYSCTIHATVMKDDKALLTKKIEKHSIQYPGFFKHTYTQTCSIKGGTHGLGIVQFKTMDDGNYSHFWYAY